MEFIFNRRIGVKMSLRCDFTFEDADFLLKRNWFLDMEGLNDLIAELPEDVYYEVLEHRKEYDPNVRWALSEPEINPRFLRMKVRNITDAEWQNMEDKKELERKRRMDEERKLFVPPPRPRGDIDDLIDSVSAEIETEKQFLDKLLVAAKKTQKYLAWSRRGQVAEESEEIRASRERLKSAENGFLKLKEALESSIKIWNDTAWYDAVLKDVARKLSSRTSAPAPTPSA